MKIFSIYDEKADAYNQPFFSPTVATAIRSCEEAIADSQSPFHAHASDYSLFELGEFDQLTGEIDAQLPRCIIKLHELQRENAPLRVNQILEEVIPNGQDQGEQHAQR